jgi:hypothetical protein
MTRLLGMTYRVGRTCREVSVKERKQVGQVIAGRRHTARFVAQTNGANG